MTRPPVIRLVSTGAAVVFSCLTISAVTRDIGAKPMAAPITDVLEITLLADKPTVVKTSQPPIGLIRVMPKTLRMKAPAAGKPEQVVDFTGPGAYAMVYAAGGPKKMPAAYFMMPANSNAMTPMTDVQLNGPTPAAKGSQFACLLPTFFDAAKGFTFNAQVENTGGLKNCASVPKGFKVAIEYNPK